MGWDQLLSIMQDNQQLALEEQQRREVPTACPVCSAPLDVNEGQGGVPGALFTGSAPGDRNCPLGHYRWAG